MNTDRGHFAGSRVAVWAAAALLLGADLPDRAELDCLDRAAVVVYVHQLQDRVLDAWGIPIDTLAGQVVVSLRLTRDGSLVSHEIVSWTNRRLATSVAMALGAAAPFAPIPDEADCLAGKRITLRFQN